MTEGVRVGWQGERPDTVTGGEPRYLGLHPGWTEENRLAAAFPDQLDRFSCTVGVIAINQDGNVVPTDSLSDGFSVSEEARFHSAKLDHQTQQRRDDFFARENQHIFQKASRKDSDRVDPATCGPLGWLARCRHVLYSFGNK